MADLERVLWSPALAEQEEEGEEDGWGKEPAGVKYTVGGKESVSLSLLDTTTSSRSLRNSLKETGQKHSNLSTLSHVS